MEQPAHDLKSEKRGETLRRFVRRGARSHVAKMLRGTRSEDVAIQMRGLTPDQVVKVMRILVDLDLEKAGDVLRALDTEQRVPVIEQLENPQLTAILEPMSVDDVVFIVESLPRDTQERVVELVDRSDLTEVQSHLTYLDDSAGRIMSPDFFSLREGTTVQEAIETIRGLGDVEMIFYVYIVDRRGHLVGVASLRELLLSPPDRTLAEIMSRAMIKVRTDTDQEDVAQLAARYDLLAIPVVDEDNRLVGIVTVDDIIDVVREEATEDFYKMVGTSDNELLYQDRAFKVASIRLPWILVNLAGLVITGLLLSHFQLQLAEALFLITFVPVIMGMGGNIGSQTSTIAVRGLASGRIGLGQGRVARFLIEQAKVGAVIGLASAVLVGAAAFFLQQNPAYALVVGVSLFLAIWVASVNGAAIPVAFERLGIDPAIAAGPLVTTSSDIIGICIYFGLALFLIDMLVV